MADRSAADATRKTLGNLQRGITEMERMTQGWPAEQRARVLDYLHEQQRIERARLRAHDVVIAPRPAARHREPRSKPACAVAGVAHVAVAGDETGGGPGGDDDEAPHRDGRAVA